MPLGLGWWYDRRNRRWYLIDEHATDAIQWRRFRSAAVAHLNPVRDRDAIVRHVARQGYIRVRYYKGNLGWEFAGRPDQGLSVLRRFLRRHEVGPFTVVNITDFHTDRSICVSASDVLAFTSARALGLTKRQGRRTR